MTTPRTLALIIGIIVIIAGVAALLLTAPSLPNALAGRAVVPLSPATEAGAIDPRDQLPFVNTTNIPSFAERDELIDWLKREYAAVPYTDITSASVADIAALVDQTIDDQGNLLTAESRRALAERLALHIHARAQFDGEVYAKLADSEPTRWLGPSDEPILWDTLDRIFRDIWNEPVPKTDPRGALVRFMTYRLSERGLRFTGIGTGRTGTAVRTQLLTHIDQVTSGFAFGGDASRYYIGLGSGSGARFRVLKTPVEDAFRARKELTTAHAMLVMQTAIQEPSILGIELYFDTPSGQWVAYRMTSHGVHRHGLAF